MAARTLTVSEGRPMELEDRWLARAIVAGFSASIIMTVVAVVGYTLSGLLAGVPLASGAQGALGNTQTVERWFMNLRDNSVVNLAVSSMYAALAVHGLMGLVWAIVYARFAEPRLGGNGWEKGMLFSLIPWILSLVVFFPLVGAGFFGLELGAGPLPVLGNLILHLCYGASLGLVYGPVGDTLMENVSEGDRRREQMAMRRAESGTAKGLLIGLLVGFLVGLGGFFLGVLSHAQMVLGLSPAWFMFSMAVAGCALGALVGSIVSLPTGTDES